jgi:ABC-2 type transport system ATP-binding protein
LPAISVTHLKKKYGSTIAIDDVSFSVNEGEIFGLLGPNGAGKTTTVECIVGLRHQDSGTIEVLGEDPQTHKEDLHPIVGVQLQSSSFPDKLKVREILDLYQSFYTTPANPVELATSLGLDTKLDTYYKDLSGGQKQRLSLALALIGQPKVAILDEMTTGLDPQARLDTWKVIEKIKSKGTTIILVTHFMEEAQRLCDRVALIDQGKTVAMDTPQGLAESVTGGKHIQFTPSKEFPDTILTRLPEVKDVEHQGNRIVVSGSGNLVNAIVLALEAQGIEANDLVMQSATLEEAFITLTGHHLHSEDEGKHNE